MTAWCLPPFFPKIFPQWKVSNHQHLNIFVKSGYESSASKTPTNRPTNLLTQTTKSLWLGLGYCSWQKIPHERQKGTTKKSLKLLLAITIIQTVKLTGEIVILDKTTRNNVTFAEGNTDFCKKNTILVDSHLAKGSK